MRLLIPTVRHLFSVHMAKAGCPTDCWYETDCYLGVIYQRRCCDHANCPTTCTNWARIGNC
jgi:hypothetical protein